MSADSPASVVYQQKIIGKEVVSLTSDEKFIFARWLALFMMRTPTTLKAMNEMTQNVNQNPAALLPFLFGRDDNLSIRRDVLAKIQREYSTIYRETISEYGQEQGELLLLIEVMQSTFEGKINWSANPQQVRDTHLRTTELGTFATILCQKFRWIFYRTEKWFVIGDNPLVRWHARSHRWNCGIRVKGVEITMPLASNLMLHLSQSQRRRCDDRVKPISGRMRRLYNRRQRIAALRYLYAAEAEHLVPFILLKATPEELKRWEIKPPLWEYLKNPPIRMPDQH